MCLEFVDKVCNRRYLKSLSCSVYWSVIDDDNELR